MAISLLAKAIIFSFYAFSNSSPITNPLKEGGDVSKVIPEYFDTKKFKPYHNHSPQVTALSTLTAINFVIP
jgi:hypothetical protein